MHTGAKDLSDLYLYHPMGYLSLRPKSLHLIKATQANISNSFHLLPHQLSVQRSHPCLTV